MNQVLETTKFVVDNSVSVKIDRNKIVDFAKSFRHGNLSHWLNASPVSYAHLNDEDKLNFVLVFNSTSFCYWGDPKWTVEYKGEKYDGSWAMVACIFRAIDEGRPIFDAKYRTDVSWEDYQEILRGNVEIPLFEERWKITRDIADMLLKRYEGSFGNLVKSANGDAQKLLQLITAQFPSFEDVATYKERKIYFYKRAQLLVEDIYQLFDGEGYGDLVNLDGFTACADYKLPQSMRKLGLISYTKDLAEKIDKKIQILSGSSEEVEIRANTIWVVEIIREELQKIGKIVSSSAINDHLWLMGQTKSADEKPYHRTLTTAY
jgi:hypothetical protein